MIANFHFVRKVSNDYSGYGRCTLFLSVTVSPEIYGIVSGDRLPSPRIQRGMMLLSKILQNLANHVLFKKEKHMLVFNDFLRENFERSIELVTCISLCY